MSKGRRFAQVPIRAIGDRALSLTPLRVLMAVCAHANDGKAWCSLPTISEMTGIDTRNLSGAIAALERAGYLRRAGWHNGRTGRSRNYEVIYDETNSSPQMTSETSANSSRGMTSEEGPKSYDDMTSSPDMTSCVQMIEVIPTHDVESLQLMPGYDQTDHKNTDQKTDQKHIPLDDTIEAEFNELWAIVIKRVDKIEAAKEFRKARIKKRVPFQTILRGMQIYVRQYNPHGSDDPRYSVSPKKWLAGEKWNDEPIAVGRIPSDRDPWAWTKAANSRAGKLDWLNDAETEQPDNTIDGEIIP